MSDQEDAFGFGAASHDRSADRLRDRIRQIKPMAPATTPDLNRVDAVAESAGFVSREVTSPQPEYQYRGRNSRPEPRIPLNMRVPVSLGQAFQKFCEENRYSYPEALEEMMKRAGLPLRG